MQRRGSACGRWLAAWRIRWQQQQLLLACHWAPKLLLLLLQTA
jgi:hypothetical protein